MRLSISHETTYHYEDQVRASIQYLRLTPHDSERQHVLSWQLDLPRPVRAQIDPFGNILHVLTLDEPHDAIIIGARGQVDIDELREAEHESQSAFPFLRCTRLTEPDEALCAFAQQHCHQRRDRTALIDLMHALNQSMIYTPGCHRSRHLCRPGLRRAGGGVPGPYPCVPGLRAQPGHSCAVCVGVFVHGRQHSPGQPRLGRSLAG